MLPPYVLCIGRPHQFRWAVSQIILGSGNSTHGNEWKPRPSNPSARAITGASQYEATPPSLTWHCNNSTRTPCKGEGAWGKPQSRTFLPNDWPMPCTYSVSADPLSKSAG